MNDELAPGLRGREGFDEGSLAPALGSPAERGRRPWWRSLRGPIAVLLADLEAPVPRVRRRAAEALARLGDRRATPALAHGLRDRHWEVRLACLEALVRLDSDGLLGLLERATRDGHPRVRLPAALALARQGDARGLAPLEALVAYLAASAQEADRRVVLAALEGLRLQLAEGA